MRETDKKILYPESKSIISHKEKKSKAERVRMDKNALVFSHTERGKNMARSEKIILPPSKNETGKRLDIPTHRFIKIKSISPSFKDGLARKRKRKAKRRLKRGPKSATISSFL